MQLRDVCAAYEKSRAHGGKSRLPAAARRDPRSQRAARARTLRVMRGDASDEGTAVSEGYDAPGRGRRSSREAASALIPRAEALHEPPGDENVPWTPTPPPIVVGGEEVVFDRVPPLPDDRDQLAGRTGGESRCRDQRALSTPSAI